MPNQKRPVTLELAGRGREGEGSSGRAGAEVLGVLGMLGLQVAAARVVTVREGHGGC